METQAYFQNIKDVILSEIDKAQNEVCVAVPWFTDNDLFAALLQRAKKRITVRLITLDDEINRKQGVDTNILQSSGGKVYKILHGSDSPLMHNKFCVIDRNVVITGSYNWSRKAQHNNENITVTKGDYELSLQFLNEFNRLIELYFGEKAAEVVNISKLIKRLQVVKYFISLGDTDELATQINKLRALPFSADLNELLQDVDAKRYTDAVAKIELFVSRYQRVAIYEDPEVNTLQLEVKALEMELISISNEKADAEKLLLEFMMMHNKLLGALISKILRLKIELLKSRAIVDESKQEEFEAANRDYERYHEQYTENKEKRHFELSSEEQAVLRKKYREAARKCHPDKVPLELKKQAEEIFNALQEAYQENDIKKVSEILDQINKGNFFVSRTEKITEKVKLKAEAARLRNHIKKLALELEAIKATETYQTIKNVKSWGEYFGKTKQMLEQQLSELEAEVGEAES